MSVHYLHGVARMNTKLVVSVVGIASWALCSLYFLSLLSICNQLRVVCNDELVNDVEVRVQFHFVQID